jgi:hypothetical protein
MTTADRKLRRYLASSVVQRSPGERALLSRDVSRALVERLAGHRGLGASSRTAKLTVVGGK